MAFFCSPFVFNSGNSMKWHNWYHQYLFTVFFLDINPFIPRFISNLKKNKFLFLISDIWHEGVKVWKSLLLLLSDGQKKVYFRSADRHSSICLNVWWKACRSSGSSYGQVSLQNHRFWGNALFWGTINFSQNCKLATQNPVRNLFCLISSEQFGQTVKNVAQVQMVTF